MHARKLKVQFHEDCLMKMFMATLEGKARSWYEGFPSSSLYSLKDFHLVFFEKYKESHPFLSLVDNCCDHVENDFIQNLEKNYGEEELMDEEMDEEILEALHENPFHHKEDMVTSLLPKNQVIKFLMQKEQPC